MSRSSIAALLRCIAPGTRIRELSDEDMVRMERGVETLRYVLEAGEPVYGVTHGFGPFVDFRASSSELEQGSGLICHLATSQGDSIDPMACRLAVWLRLQNMRHGYSAVSPTFWRRLADAHDAGFVPVMPRFGTVSASGDLQPLAHAALAFTGVGEAWRRGDDGTWALTPAEEALALAGLTPIQWPAREALAFVNGTSVSLAVSLLNHLELQRLVRAAASLSARVATLLRANPEAYHPGISEVRNQRGQARVAGWIRAELPPGLARGGDRPLQEAYSVRAAPQVLGAVWDQLEHGEDVLGREAAGCTDNPICFEGEVLHGANFHSMPVALVSDQMGLCLQQVAFLVERQLALLCSPTRNGGLPPMLTPRPGASSGLAGVQTSASSFVSSIRQRAYPASLTAIPTNGDNQDHIPMALNGAIAVSEAVELAWYVIGSLGVAVAQYAALSGQASPEGVWADLAELCPPLRQDRPLAAEVRDCARRLKQAAAEVVDHSLDEVDGHDSGQMLTTAADS